MDEQRLVSVASIRDVRSKLPDIPLDHAVIVPGNLIIDDSGVWLYKAGDKDDKPIPVSHEPFIISRKIIDLEEETEKWEITFRHDGKWSKIIRPRIVFADPKKLLPLADYSFPVDGCNLREMTLALRIMGIDSRPPLIYSLSTPGWKHAGGNTYFVYGTNLIGNKNGEIIYTAPDPVTEKSMEGYRKNGSLDGWLEMFDDLLNNFPRVASSVFHSLAAPLLKIVGAPNYCVDLFGDTSKGKTTFSKVGASVWGCPDGPNKILRSWDMTRVYSERGPAMACDMPFFLEESQLADRDESHKLLMMIVNGTGRGRGSLMSVQSVRQWNTVLFSTGEKSVAEATTLGGAAARTLPYFGSPFGNEPQEQYVKQLEFKLTENYGHVGPHFVKYLIETKEGWPDLKLRYGTLLKKVMLDMKGAVQSRIAAYIAVLWLAAEIFLEIFVGSVNPELTAESLIEGLIKSIMGDMFIDPIWKRALDDVLGWVSGSTNYFTKEVSGQDFGPVAPARGDIYGIVKDSETCVYKHRLEQFLEMKKYPPASIFRQWKENGILKYNGTSVTYPVKVNGSSVRMIVLKTVR